MSDKDSLEDLKQLLTRKIGLRVPVDAHERFVGLLHERAARRNDGSLEAYRRFLTGNQAGEEWELFARTFTSSETFFFRDHGQFDLLRLRLLPELIAKHSADKTLRLWSAGCASGEEAYSLAMLVDMLLPGQGDWQVLILGTDIDSQALAKARQGRYGQWSFRMVPAALQQRYFERDSGEWLLNERIRRMVKFQALNLVDDTFPDVGSELHGMDLIVCRNVFIYFESVVVSAIAAKFFRTLSEGGYLLAAHTELMGHPVQGLKSRLFAEGIAHQRQTGEAVREVSLPTPPLVQPVEATLPVATMSVDKTTEEPLPAPPQAQKPNEDFCQKARDHADRGEYELAEQACHQALSEESLAAEPYFLLAQLAQLKGNIPQAKEFLNKAIYIDPSCAAAYLELAVLYERSGDVSRARALRHTALGVLSAMADDQRIEQYETTAGELAQWLAQCESSSATTGDFERGHSGGQ